MIDVAKMPELIKRINDALNSGKIIEVKNERKKDTPVNVTVVEIKRTLLK